MTLPHDGICNDCYMRKKCKPSTKEQAEMFGCGLLKKPEIGGKS